MHQSCCHTACVVQGYEVLPLCLYVGPSKIRHEQRCLPPLSVDDVSTHMHAHTHFSREHSAAHSTRGSRYKERVCHLSFLSCVMSLLFPPHLPIPVSFLCTMCSPPAPTSPTSASSTSTARIRQRSPCASACHWRESGPLTDFEPNTGHEPHLSAKVADSFSYLDFMHNPTAFQQHKVCP